MSASPLRLDMTGLACPLPLLGAKKMLDDLPDGQSLVLISDCPGTGDDLQAWAAETGHEIVHAEPLNGRRFAYTIRRRPTQAPQPGQPRARPARPDLPRPDRRGAPAAARACDRAKCWC
ncbi:MAG: sulfurtransferase TusA family protein [Chromatiales bacterium]|nr:sulfurtransferase TusA family protein [Chromatiales bacterium]